jgi:hypothetical protein
VSSSEEFIEFAGAAAPRLRRTAFLLCGDWHTAQDLTQTALAKVFVAWRRISRADGAHAYAHRTLVNSYLALRRKRDSTELLVGEVAERRTGADTADLRIVLLAALGSLTPKARAALLGGHDRRPGGRDPRLLGRQREEPELACPGPAPSAPRRFPGRPPAVRMTTALMI